MLVDINVVEREILNELLLREIAELQVQKRSVDNSHETCIAYHLAKLRELSNKIFVAKP